MEETKANKYSREMTDMELATEITDAIKRLTTILTSFGDYSNFHDPVSFLISFFCLENSCRYKLSVLDAKMTSLERKCNFLEVHCTQRKITEISAVLDCGKEEEEQEAVKRPVKLQKSISFRR